MSETVAVAFAGLTANKLRTGLTILGLMIGVGSVIVLIAVGTGSSNAVEKQIDALGSNVLMVTTTPTLGGLRGGASTSSTQLTLADTAALQNGFRRRRQERLAGRQRQRRHAHLQRDHLPALVVRRHDPSYQQARNYTIAEGSWFTNAQENSHSRVAVVGPTVVSELFGGQDPVGDTIQVNGTNYTIVGVTASKGSNGTSNQDDVVIAPLTAVQDTLTGYGSLSQIVVQANSRDGAERRPDRGDRHPRPAPPDHELVVVEQFQRDQPGIDPADLDRAAARCSPPCSARSPRSRCSSAGSA